MAKRGGVGMGLSDPDLVVQYLIEGGAAEACGMVSVGDRVIAVDRCV